MSYYEALPRSYPKLVFGFLAQRTCPTIRTETVGEAMLVVGAFSNFDPSRPAMLIIDVKKDAKRAIAEVCSEATRSNGVGTGS